MKYFVSFLLTFLMAAPLQAADGYFNLGTSLKLYREETPFYKAQWAPISLQVAFGNMFNDYIGVEGRLGTGIIDSEVEIGGSKVTAKAKTNFGGYLRYNFVNEKFFKPYALLGVSDHTITSDGGSEVNINGTSFGIGLSWRLPNKNGPKKKPYTYVEYIQHPTKETSTTTQELRSINFGMHIPFSFSSN